MTPNIVIYSALVGDYDLVRQPMIIDKRFDYILFSNEIAKKNIGVWKIQPIPCKDLDNTLICRYVKTHSNELLSNYKFSIWMDASMQIVSSFVYDRALELCAQNIQISSMWHPFRDCIYDEAFAVMNGMTEHEQVVVKWCHKLYKEKYPIKNGLCETGFLFRKHTDVIEKFNKIWWDSIIEYSRRDQLSFNYVLWKMGIQCHYFFGEGKNVRNTTFVQLKKHCDTTHNTCTLSKNEAWLMRYCWKNKDKTKSISNLYFSLYKYPCPMIFITIVGYFFRIKYIYEKHVKSK